MVAEVDSKEDKICFSFGLGRGIHGTQLKRVYASRIVRFLSEDP